MEPVNFTVNEDFRVVVAGKEVVIPRMKFRTAKRVLALLGRASSRENMAALPILRAADKLKADPGKKEVRSFTETVEAVTAGAFVFQGADVIEDILVEVSEGAISRGSLEQMVYEEALGLARYLLEKNFEALKNWSASLQAITTSGK